MESMRENKSMRTRKAEKQLAYDLKHCTRFYLKMGNVSDADVIQKLKSVSNRQGYIKSLIRKDIAESGEK